jgi:transposase InsO family protein
LGLSSHLGLLVLCGAGTRQQEADSAAAAGTSSLSHRQSAPESEADAYWKETREPAKPNEWWRIDMTKVLVGDFGWLAIVGVLDWYTATMVGSYASLPCTASRGRAALDMAVNRQFPDGARDRGVSLMSGNGCQQASMAFLETCSTLGIHQALTRWNHPKGNATLSA